jgi:hypothetical protein
LRRIRPVRWFFDQRGAAWALVASATPVST